MAADPARQGRQAVSADMRDVLSTVTNSATFGGPATPHQGDGLLLFGLGGAWKRPNPRAKLTPKANSNMKPLRPFAYPKGEQQEIKGERQSKWFRYCKLIKRQEHPILVNTPSLLLTAPVTPDLIQDLNILLPSASFG